LAESNVTINRSRIFFVGHERAGKTTLISALTGQNNETSKVRQPTEGIGCDGITAKIYRNGKWKKYPEVGHDNENACLESEKRSSIANSVAKSILEKSKKPKRRKSEKDIPSSSTKILSKIRRRSTSVVKVHF
jgi:GTPase SAR1 family protein